jgi:hypothetical protein
MLSLVKSSKKDKIINVNSNNMELFESYMKVKLHEKNSNSYTPDKNGIKYLVVIACHCNSDRKLQTIINNLKYFSFDNIHIIIINSSGLNYGNTIYKHSISYRNTTYLEIENSNYCDFGKWIHILKNTDYNINNYDYIVLTNDSFYINSDINHFFNLTYKYNVELYGYNDSTQLKYHYQSYLFSLRKDAVETFINRVSDKTLKINSLEDVIVNFELNMTTWFKTHKSFLTIGNFKLHQGKNIFFTNDKLYIPLKNSGLLPFIKLKRVF